MLYNTSERSVADEIMNISLLHKRVWTSVADEMLIISLLHKRVRMSVADEMLIISLSHKRVRTSVADEIMIISLLHSVLKRLLLMPCSFDLFVGMPIISTIECTYLMRAHYFKIYLLNLTVLNTTLSKCIKSQRSIGPFGECIGKLL